MQDGKGDQATQNDQLDVMIEKGVDVLAVNMVDAKAAAGVVEKAKAAGIPTVFFNREPDTDVIASYEKAIFIGTNAADAGKMQRDQRQWYAIRTFHNKATTVCRIAEREEVEALAWAVQNR